MGWKNEAGLSYTVPVSAYSLSVYVFLACPAEMLPTLWLKTGRLSALKGSVQVRSVMFTTGRFPFKYCQLVFRVCQEAESWYLSTTGLECLQDGYSVGQDRKCNRQDGFVR